MYNVTFKIFDASGNSKSVSEDVSCLNNIFSHVKTLFDFLDIVKIETIPTDDIVDNNMNNVLYFTPVILGEKRLIRCTKFLSYVE